MAKMEPATDPEKVDHLDSHGRVLGQVFREEMRQQNLLHRAVSILVYNPLGEIVLHKRSLDKDIYPGLYDVFVGGVVAAGESSLEGAQRELQEELGIQTKTLKPLFSLRYTDRKTKSLLSLFSLCHQGALKPQEEELSWVAWKKPLEVKAWEESLCPDSACLWAFFTKYPPFRGFWSAGLSSF